MRTPNHNTSDALRDLHYIYTLIRQKSRYACSEKNPAIKRLTEKYNIEPEEATVLSFVCHDQLSYMGDSCPVLEHLLNSETAVKNAAYGLVRKGFLDYTPWTELDTAPMYKISDEAYAALSTDAPFKNLPFDDCIAELKRCVTSTIYYGDWLIWFTQSIEEGDNEQLKKAYEVLHIGDMDESQQKAFWAIASHFAKNFDMAIKLEEDDTDSCFPSNLNEFVKMGLVDVTVIESDYKVNKEYHLSAKVASLLFKGREDVIKYDNLSKYATVVKCEDIRMKELFFSATAQEEVGRLKVLLSREGYARAKQILERKKRPTGIISMLWGSPGTGKTETAKQLALESGRDLIVFDAAKVTGTGWGVTEKSYRGLFRAYNYIAVISEQVPILLLNEADGILSKRLGAINYSIDKSENGVTNILLEELEKFNGILLATTNLLDNIDKAFDRRFVFKTRLEKPDARARLLIWKSLIPELSETEAGELATAYVMSGAQIDNVATKRELAELYYEGDRGIEYIKGLCEEELRTEGGTRSSRTRIGYHA